MTEIKVFTICDHCNKEYELPLAENNAGIFTVFSTCPFCKGNNNRWLKILIPRKEDSGTLEEHLANLRKQSPAKCQDCECLHVENHGPDHAGYVYVCETSPKCYKENTTQ